MLDLARLVDEGYLDITHQYPDTHYTLKQVMQEVWPEGGMPKQVLHLDDERWAQWQSTQEYKAFIRPRRSAPVVPVSPRGIGMALCDCCEERKVLHHVLDARPPSSYGDYCSDCIERINEEAAEDLRHDIADLRTDWRNR